MQNSKRVGLSAVVFIAMCGIAQAQQSSPPAAGAPPWLKLVPEKAQSGISDATNALLRSGNAISPKEEALIGLAVSSQIPCEYCVDAMRNSARQAGASAEEMRQAVAIAGIVRFISAVEYGNQMPKPVVGNTPK
jgi:AhpD family alkylhydroperoxidase